MEFFLCNKCKTAGNDNGLFQKESKQGVEGGTGVEDIFLNPSPREIFRFVPLSLKTLGRQALTTGKSAISCDIPWKFQDKKPRLMEIPNS